MEFSRTRDQTCVPALTGRFLSTVPPGKSSFLVFFKLLVLWEFLSKQQLFLSQQDCTSWSRNSSLFILCRCESQWKATAGDSFSELSRKSMINAHVQACLEKWRSQRKTYNFPWPQVGCLHYQISTPRTTGWKIIPSGGFRKIHLECPCSTISPSALPLERSLWVCSVTKSRPTLCDTMDCSAPGSSVREILQARILERVAISPSRGSFPPRDQTCISCLHLLHWQVDSFTTWATWNPAMLH